MRSAIGPDVNVICMKWGSLYGPAYVNNLHQGVTRYLKRPHRFICFTDDAKGIHKAIETAPLPDLTYGVYAKDSRWRKLSLFSPTLANLSGLTLFLDLDVVIVGSLDIFFEYPGEVLMIRDDDLFRPKPLRKLNPRRDDFLASVGNSSVFRYEIGVHRYIYDSYCSDPDAAHAGYEISQQFQSAQLLERGHLSYWPADLCVSFKNRCVPPRLRSFWQNPAIPVGARIVVFAGRPKMAEVLAGQGSRWYRRIGNVDWLRAAWDADNKE